MNVSIGFVSLIFICLAVEDPSKTTHEIKTLIGKIQEVSEIGNGYSTVSTGDEFLPQPDSQETRAFLFSNLREKSSPVLRRIVEQGVAAVPLLIDHLSDERKTAIPPVSALMSMLFADEYDFNRRTRLKAPAGVNRDTVGQKNAETYAITVGDLCFVALGQIVNRNFSCCRYYPSGGLVINSPTYSKSLRDQVIADFQGLTQDNHKKLLKEDFLRPDHEFRRIGAYRRLAFYYPSEVEDLVLKQLSVSESARSDGVRLQLFDDLDTQEADEENRISRPGHPGDSRTLLIELYGYQKTVKSTEKPYVNSWKRAEMARFIKSLVHDRSKKIDQRVSEIFKAIGDDDYLALACMARLVGRGYEKETRDYCLRRIGKDKHYQDELQSVIKRLDSPHKQQ